jgi:uncharacterized membrane protein YjjP (DUF1212 family)
MTRVPVMVRIRRRKTQEGGSDIDVVSKLKEAAEKVEEEENNIEKLKRELNEFIRGGNRYG